MQLNTKDYRPSFVYPVPNQSYQKYEPLIEAITKMPINSSLEIDEPVNLKFMEELEGWEKNLGHSYFIDHTAMRIWRTK